jgi:hypothetical protein
LDDLEQIKNFSIDRVFNKLNKDLEKIELIFNLNPLSNQNFSKKILISNEISVKFINSIFSNKTLGGANKTPTNETSSNKTPSNENIKTQIHHFFNERVCDILCNETATKPVINLFADNPGFPQIKESQRLFPQFDEYPFPKINKITAQKSAAIN